MKLWELNLMKLKSKVRRISVILKRCNLHFSFKCIYFCTCTIHTVNCIRRRYSSNIPFSSWDVMTSRIWSVYVVHVFLFFRLYMYKLKNNTTFLRLVETNPLDKVWINWSGRGPFLMRFSVVNRRYMNF